jgi:hypothetical protein
LVRSIRLLESREGTIGFAIAGISELSIKKLQFLPPGTNGTAKNQQHIHAIGINRDDILASSQKKMAGK